MGLSPCPTWVFQVESEDLATVVVRKGSWSRSDQEGVCAPSRKEAHGSGTRWVWAFVGKAEKP